MNLSYLVESINDKNLFKAIIFIGSPGSGKTTISKKMFGFDDKLNLSGMGSIKRIDTDIHFERMGGKGHQDFSKEEVRERFYKARDLRDTQYERFRDEYISLVIDGTGRDYNWIETLKLDLSKKGYDVFLIYVNTDTKKAVERNLSRERNLRTSDVIGIASEVKRSVPKFKELFGSNFMEIDNNENIDIDLKKVGRKIINSPLKNPIGKDILKNANKKFSEEELNIKI